MAYTCRQNSCSGGIDAITANGDVRWMGYRMQQQEAVETWMRMWKSKARDILRHLLYLGIVEYSRRAIEENGEDRDGGLCSRYEAKGKNGHH